MAEHHDRRAGDLPAWIYRGGLTLLMAGTLYIASEMRADLREFGRQVVDHTYKLQAHDRRLDDVEAELRRQRALRGEAAEPKSSGG